MTTDRHSQMVELAKKSFDHTQALRKPFCPRCHDGYLLKPGTTCNKCSRFSDRCKDCYQHRPDDERVENNQRCRFCAYGGG